MTAASPSQVEDTPGHRALDQGARALTHDFWRISCVRHPCPATVMVSRDTEAQAIAAWNTRTAMDNG